MKSVFSELANSKYRISSTDADLKPLSVNRDTEDGYISVKNDFCTHIIEFALPPRGSPSALRALYVEVYDDIANALEKRNLKIKFGGSLKTPPKEISILPGHPRTEWLATRDLPGGFNPLVFRYFTSLMCATQVHLNILDENFFRYLSRFYSLEFIFPLIFTNSSNYNGSTGHCVRPLAWEANFFPSYLATSFPTKIPTDQLAYSQMLLETVGFQRDYSFICPRQTGSVEFRSTCSQDSVEEILNLVAMRIAAANFASSSSPITLSNRDDFYSVCRTGRLTSLSQVSCLREFLAFDHRPIGPWFNFLERKLSALQGIAA